MSAITNSNVDSSQQVQYASNTQQEEHRYRVALIAIPIILAVAVVSIAAAVTFSAEILAVPIIIIAALLILGVSRIRYRPVVYTSGYYPPFSVRVRNFTDGFRFSPPSFVRSGDTSFWSSSSVSSPSYGRPSTRISQAGVREQPGSGQTIFTSSRSSTSTSSRSSSPSRPESPPRGRAETVVVPGSSSGNTNTRISQHGFREQIGRRS